jgi:transcriptional regulator with XRE-family HTH domain
MRSTRSTSFDEFYGELEKEAQAEGPEAIRDLRAKEFKYGLINALITRRRDLHLTQASLAERSGVAQTEISRIERGRKSPTMDTFSRLASALLMDLWPAAGRDLRHVKRPSAAQSGLILARRQQTRLTLPAHGTKRTALPSAAKRSISLQELTHETKPRVKATASSPQKTPKSRGGSRH